MLEKGDFAPWFEAPALSGLPNYKFDTVAGRYVLLLFHGSAAKPESRDALDLALGARALFDDRRACFFGITQDAEDGPSGRIAQSLPGVRHLLDLDGRISTRYGAIDRSGEPHPYWLLLGPDLRVVARFDLLEGAAAIDRLRQCVEAPPLTLPAPVLQIPDVFEVELCHQLIALYDRDGGTPSGFMREIGGKTVEVEDVFHKQRRDVTVDDAALRARIQDRIRRRILPVLERAFQYRATRIERYLVACYEAGRGHFRPHRDNSTRGTAHRRFAITINLDAEVYEGGDLRFPEFGPATYRAQTGGAVVFSCSLMHEATPVTAGRRLCFLPFLYDEEGARLREANNRHLDPDVGEYRREALASPR